MNSNCLMNKYKLQIKHIYLVSFNNNNNLMLYTNKCNNSLIMDKHNQLIIRLRDMADKLLLQILIILTIIIIPKRHKFLLTIIWINKTIQ